MIYNFHKWFFLGVVVLIFNGSLAQPLPFDFSWGKEGVLPVVFDLRDTERLAKVRSQPAGGCWASAAISTVESFRKTAGFDDPPLSDRHMQLFHGFNQGRNSNGNYRMATAYFSRRHGPVIQNPETDTLYSSLLQLPFFISEAWYLPNDPVLIKQLILSRGPVYSMMHFRKERHDTISNIYYAHKEGINHVVTLVGWNDTLRTRFGSGAWIAQNSLGTRFGDNGFFYVPYQDKNILNHNAVWPGWTPFNPNERILYYDTLGSYHSFGFGDSVCYGLVKFTAHQTGKLTHVATFVNHPGTRVQASVYSDFDTVSYQLSGLLKSVRETRFSYAGYYSIDLGKEIAFNAGTDFFILMKYTTDGDTLPMPVETFVPDYASPVLSRGKCWVNPDFERWPDAWHETGVDAQFKSLKFNLCIRGYFIADSHNARNSLDYYGVYRGILPCADCEGIETEIELKPESRFVIMTKYPGKGTEAVTETSGTFAWNEDGNIITLMGLSPVNQYFVGENVLNHLDKDGKKFTGALEALYVLRKSSK